MPLKSVEIHLDDQDVDCPYCGENMMIPMCDFVASEDEDYLMESRAQLCHSCSKEFDVLITVNY